MPGGSLIDASQPSPRESVYRRNMNAPNAATDPICGMTVDVAAARYTHAFGRSIWYFCSKHCLDRFTAEPQRAVYTFPTHPEIRQPRPDACPKCGMALEPVRASAEEGPNPELAD